MQGLERRGRKRSTVPLSDRQATANSFRHVQVLFSTLLDLTLGRRGPDSLPSSWLLFVVLAVLLLALQAVSVLVVEQGSARDFAFFAGLGGASYLFFALLLKLARKAARTAQTLSAIAGIDLVLSIAGFGVSLLLLIPAIGGPLAFIALLAILIGYVYRVATILAAALDWPLFAALALSLAINLASLSLVERYHRGHDATLPAAMEPVPRTTAGFS